MMETLLTSFTELGLLATYAIVFFGMFIEGEAFLILAGILVRGQVVDYTDTILVAFCAVILHDIGYWFIGKRLSMTKKERGWFINMEKTGKILKKLKKREGLYIFMSKFAWGMNRFALLSSGYSNTPIRKFLKYSIPAAFIWTTTFVSVGFMFADRAGLWKKDVKMVALLAATFFIGMVIFEYQVGKSIKEDADLPNGDSK